MTTSVRLPAEIATALIVIAAGYFLPLHLIGTMNLLFGVPVIQPLTVVLVSVAGLSLGVFASVRAGLWNSLGDFRLPRSRALRAMGVGTALLYGFLFIDTLWSYPSGYDVLAYHGNVALHWLQQGTMRIDPAWGWKYSMPSNAELPALLALAAGFPREIAEGNLPAALLLALAVYLIALRVAGASGPAFITALVTLSIPIVLYQAVQLYVDLFGTAFLLAAIAMIVWRGDRPGLYVLLAGYSAGLAIGAKPVFWTYGLLFTVGATLAILRGPRARIRSLALLFAGLTLGCGFWFVRSAVATGNPVFPMRVSIAGHEIFHGYDRTDITSPDYGIGSLPAVLIEPWVEKVSGNEMPVSSERGTGPLFAAIAVPGVLFLIVQAARRRVNSVALWLLIGTAVGFVMWYAALLTVLRFALPLIALSCALSALMLRYLLIENPRVPLAICLLGIGFNGAFCLAEPVQRLSFRIRHRDFSRSSFYGYPPLIDRLPPGTRILDLTENHRSSFPLAGERLTNYVIPDGDFGAVDYVARDGPPDGGDEMLLSKGMVRIYDAVPAFIYPKTAKHWRVYRNPQTIARPSLP